MVVPSAPQPTPVVFVGEESGGKNYQPIKPVKPVVPNMPNQIIPNDPVWPQNMVPMGGPTGGPSIPRPQETIYTPTSIPRYVPDDFEPVKPQPQMPKPTPTMP
jgi:hypothetical protein